jgi:hypothetical protein
MEGSIIPEPIVTQNVTDDKTTIPCKKSTRIRIKDWGKKGESYDHLLNRVFDELERLKGEINGR